MNIVELEKILIDNNLSLKYCRINPSTYQEEEGTICMKKDLDNQGWRVFFQERGVYSFNEFFAAQHDACICFLKHVLSDCVCQKDYDPRKPEVAKRKSEEMLKKYGFRE